MGAFELQETENLELDQSSCPNPRRIREECIIALKVYDSCRQPDGR